MSWTINIRKRVCYNKETEIHILRHFEWEAENQKRNRNQTKKKNTKPVNWNGLTQPVPHTKYTHLPKQSTLWVLRCLCAFLSLSLILRLSWKAIMSWAVVWTQQRYSIVSSIYFWLLNFRGKKNQPTTKPRRISNEKMTDQIVVVSIQHHLFIVVVVDVVGFLFAGFKSTVK